jgi:hypothetical protein
MPTPENQNEPQEPRNTSRPDTEDVVRALASIARDADEALRLTDPTSRFVGLTAVLERLEEQRAVLASHRLLALGVLRENGASYDVIARATGLHKQRIAQLAREWNRRAQLPDEG